LPPARAPPACCRLPPDLGGSRPLGAGLFHPLSEQSFHASTLLRGLMTGAAFVSLPLLAPSSRTTSCRDLAIDHP
jgi:hypothetical protein